MRDHVLRDVRNEVVRPDLCGAAGLTEAGEQAGTLYDACEHDDERWFNVLQNSPWTTNADGCYGWPGRLSDVYGLWRHQGPVKKMDRRRWWELERNLDSQLDCP